MIGTNLIKKNKKRKRKEDHLWQTNLIVGLWIAVRKKVWTENARRNYSRRKVLILFSIKTPITLMSVNEANLPLIFIF